MEEIGIFTLILLLINGIITYKGFKEVAFFNQYSFQIDKILIDKEYIRIITSGFLHVSWSHFTFNMITLFFFSRALETVIGIPSFLLIYFGSLIGGNLFSLYIHKNHSDYSAVGASGAVSGLVFASIALFPGMGIGFFLLPINIPGWLYGIAFVTYSIYGIKSQRDNIGHEAHLGGGIIGLIIAVLLNPSVLKINMFPILLILVPTCIFLYLVIKQPLLIAVSMPFRKPKGIVSFEDKYNEEKVSNQLEIDHILDKINRKGFENLSKKDKDRLKKLTK